MNDFTTVRQGVWNRNKLTDLISQTNAIPNNRIFHFETALKIKNRCFIHTGSKHMKPLRNSDSKVIILLSDEL